MSQPDWTDADYNEVQESFARWEKRNLDREHKREQEFRELEKDEKEKKEGPSCIQ